MKNKLKTTQGEWKFYQKDHWCEVQREEQLKSICAININVEEHIANGKLIACAPEMFDVLSELENDNNSIPDWLWSRIQKVLEKAQS